MGCSGKLVTYIYEGLTKAVWLSAQPLTGSPMIKDPDATYSSQIRVFHPLQGEAITSNTLPSLQMIIWLPALFVNVTLMALVPSIRLPSSHAGLLWVRRPPTSPPCPTFACIWRLPGRERAVFIHVWQKEGALQVFLSCFRGNCSVLRCHLRAGFISLEAGGQGQLTGKNIICSFQCVSLLGTNQWTLKGWFH